MAAIKHIARQSRLQYIGQMWLIKADLEGLAAHKSCHEGRLGINSQPLPPERDFIAAHCLRLEPGLQCKRQLWVHYGSEENKRTPLPSHLLLPHLPGSACQ